jgi:hypothetical protein
MKTPLKITIIICIACSNLFSQYAITPEQRRLLKTEAEKLCEWVIDDNGDKVLRRALTTKNFKSTGSVDYGCVDRGVAEAEAILIETMKCNDVVVKSAPSGYRVISSFCPAHQKYGTIVSVDNKIYKEFDSDGNLERMFDANTHVMENFVPIVKSKGKVKEDKVELVLNLINKRILSYTKVGKWIEYDNNEIKDKKHYYVEGNDISVESVGRSFENYLGVIETYRNGVLTSQETDDMLSYVNRRIKTWKAELEAEAMKEKRAEQESLKMEKFLEDSLSDLNKINNFMNDWYFRSKFDDVIRFSNKVTSSEFYNTYTIPVVNEFGSKNNYYYYFELRCKAMAYLGKNDVNSFNEVYKAYEKWTSDGKLTESILIDDHKFYVKNGTKFPEETKNVIKELKDIKNSKKLDSMLK